VLHLTLSHHLNGRLTRKKVTVDASAQRPQDDPSHVFHVYRILSETAGGTLCGAEPLRSVNIAIAWRLRGHPSICQRCVERLWQLEVGLRIDGG
jgi:hypothetical protein